jgi:hypothetical protein
MAYPMGIGPLGTLAGLTLKRKFRWIFGVKGICVGGQKLDVPETFVKSANRPNITFDEQEIHFLHGKMFIPGKATFETATVTYYDVTLDEGGDPLRPLYTWISSVYDFMSPAGGIVNPRMGKNAFGPQGYGGTGLLTMLDGTGKALETWTMFDCWPQAVNFGELDYSSAEDATIELTLRYQFAKWQGYCNKEPIDPCFDSSCGSDISRTGSFSATVPARYSAPSREGTTDAGTAAGGVAAGIAAATTGIGGIIGGIIGAVSGRSTNSSPSF